MILGIDQSYTGSGYCILDNEELMDFGIFTTNNTIDVYDRVIEFTTFLNGLIRKNSISEIHIEGLAFGIRGNATRDLAGLLFGIIIFIRNNFPNIPVKIIAPTSVKKFATGSGKAKKPEMLNAIPPQIIEKFKTKITTKKKMYDVCDSYWIAKFKS